MIAALLVLCAQSAPTIDVEAGWSGDLFGDDASRVWITIQNPGEAVEGELRVRIVGGTDGLLELRRAVPMGARSKRRVSWDAVASLGGHELRAELRGPGGAVLASRTIPIRVRTGKGRRTALLGPRIDALDPPQEPAVRLKADLVPDRLPPLLAVDAIVFGEPAALEPEQEEALRAWVEQGGVLVWSASRASAAAARPLWKDLAPADVVGYETTPLGVRSVSTARLRPRAGAQGFGELPGRPAGFRIARGYGAVVVVALPLDDPAFEGAVGSALFRAQVYPPIRRAKAPLDPRLAKSWKDVTLVDTWSDLRGNLRPQDPGPSLPRLAVGATIAILYALLAGPASWLVQRRRHFGPGWIAFVLLTAGTLAVLISWGSLLSPYPVRIDHRVFVDPGGVQGISFLRAGPGDFHRVSHAGSLGALPDPDYTGGRVSPFPVVHGEEGSFDVALPSLGAMPFVWARAAGKEEAGLRARWADGARTVLEVRNLSKGRATGIFLATDGELAGLPELGPGESRTIALSEAPKLGWQAWYGVNVGKVDRDYYGLSLYPGGRGHLLHATFAGQIAFALENRTREGVRGVDLSPLLARGEAVVVGRLDGAVGVPAVAPGGAVTTWALARCRVEGP